jgi:3-oxoacyl-[acyl-carrier-protein] synthase III
MSAFRSRIAGTGSAFPKRIVGNAELCKWLGSLPGEAVDGFSPEWIRTVTGIETRHFSDASETTSELSTRAARIALEAAGITPEAVDGIILATCTPDQVMPAAATLVQNKLGATRAFAFDLNAACSGFHHAWATAHAMIASGQSKTLLVIGADVLSAITDYTDKKSAILFGDGAGAMVLTRDDSAGGAKSDSKFILSADGAGAELLHIPGGGAARPIYGAEPGQVAPLTYSETRMQMRGHEIFKSSIRTMVDLSTRLLEEAGFTVADIDYVVPHQANLRILERVAKLQKVALDRFVMNIQERGNTSGATVPTALDHGIRCGKIQRGHRLLIPVFGAGITAGAAVVTY